MDSPACILIARRIPLATSNESRNSDISLVWNGQFATAEREQIRQQLTLAILGARNACACHRLEISIEHDRTDQTYQALVSCACGKSSQSRITGELKL